MIKKLLKDKNRNLVLFLLIIAATSLATGLSNTVFSNYFKETYDITAYQRGVLEFPRELPGLICLLVIGIGSFLGDVRVAVIAQVFSFVGIMALGLLTPMFTIMSIYLFINSLGMHTMLPLRDSIGISLIKDKSNFGKRLGQYGGTKTAFKMVAGFIVFFGFKFGFFSFKTEIKWVFIVSGLFSLLALVFLLFLNKRVSPEVQSHKKIKLVFDKDYKFYYMLAIMHGFQKQIIIVFGPWVLIEILSKGADTISVLNMIGGFLGMFMMPMIGRWLDKFGLKKMLYFDAMSFILVYIAYGIVTGLFSNGIFPFIGLPLILIYSLYVLDYMSIGMDFIRLAYLKSIAKKPDDIAPTLSTGISMDHVISIIGAYIGGIVWTKYGPEYVFYIAAALSLVNLYVARKVKIEKGD